MALQWSVVRANKLSLAKKSITERLGFEVYMPEVVVRVHKGRTHKPVRKPLLHAYLFVSIDLDAVLPSGRPDERWKLVFKQRGVQEVMCANGRPIAVPDGQLDPIRAEAAKHEGVICEEMPLSKDDVIRIIAGAFNSFPAVVVKAKDTKGNDLINIEASVMIFGRETPVTLPRDHVVPVAA